MAVVAGNRLHLSRSHMWPEAREARTAGAGQNSPVADEDLVGRAITTNHQLCVGLSRPTGTNSNNAGRSTIDPARQGIGVHENVASASAYSLLLDIGVAARSHGATYGPLLAAETCRAP